MILFIPLINSSVSTCNWDYYGFNQFVMALRAVTIISKKLSLVNQCMYVMLKFKPTGSFY